MNQHIAVLQEKWNNDSSMNPDKLDQHHT